MNEIELEKLMLETKRLAEKKIRNDFQNKYGILYRCSSCEDRVYSLGSDYVNSDTISRCCNVPVKERRYSPPPEDV